MRILITGSSGFIGGTVGRFAARAGHQVLGIARRSQPDRDWPGEHLPADVAHADLTETIERFAPDVVLHGAGTASVGASLKAPLEDLRAAAMTWANVLDNVRRSKVRPLLIFPSSAAVYGNPKELPVREDAPVNPISPYGFHKAACELLAREYADCFGLRIIVCRIFSVFGPAQRRLLVWELYEQLAGPEPVVWLQGTGRESRDFLYADDLASAMLCIARPSGQHMEANGCQFVNMGRGVETPVRELAEQLGRIVAPQKEIRCRGVERPGDPMRWRGETTRLKKMAPDWNVDSLASSLEKCARIWRGQA